MKQKLCKSCGEMKSLSAFHRKQHDTFAHECLECELKSANVSSNNTDSLSDAMDSFFSNNKEEIISEPLKFKAKLGIGEDAYKSLRMRKHLSTFSEALGIGLTGSTIAASSTIASTFFTSSSSGFIASSLARIGLGAAAATPIGWVIAAGVISGGAYLALCKFCESSKDEKVYTIPKYINTPLDIIALSLIESMLPLSLKVAHADNDISDIEANCILDYYNKEWGYSKSFIQMLIYKTINNIHNISYNKHTKSLMDFSKQNPDCNPKAISRELIDHFREIIEADGVIHNQETIDLKYVESQLLDGTSSKSNWKPPVFGRKASKSPLVQTSGRF